MQHLDDAFLAAYLDGEKPDGWTGGRVDGSEHLGGCADCQARLEALRVTRERAKAILRSGTPSGAQPSFQDVLKRRQAAKADARSLARLRPLAWAASIVLALSVGWYTRELQLRPSAPQEVELTASAKEAGKAATADKIAVTAPLQIAQNRPNTLRAQRETGAGARGKAAEAANVTVDRKDERFPAPISLAAEAPSAQPLSRASAQEEDQLKKLAPRDTQQVRLDAVVVASAESRAAEGAGAPANERVTARRARQVPSAAAPAPAPAVTRGFADAPSPVAPLSNSVVAATSVLGRPPLTVPGLEIIGYQTGPNSVRVTQRMATGVLEMVQQRPGVTDESGPSASRAVSGPGVGALVEGIQIRLWGPVSYDSLRALVARLR